MTTEKVADGQNPIYETKARKYRKELAAMLPYQLPTYYSLPCARAVMLPIIDGMLLPLFL